MPTKESKNASLSTPELGICFAFVAGTLIPLYNALVPKLIQKKGDGAFEVDISSIPNLTGDSEVNQRVRLIVEYIFTVNGFKNIKFDLDKKTLVFES